MVFVGDRQACIERLKRHRDRIDELMELIGDKPHFSSEETAKAQRMLKEIKDLLGTEYKTMGTVRGEKAMSDIEHSCYFPAIHEAFTHINVKVSSIPSSKWYGELYDARFDLDYYIKGLESHQDSGH